MHLLGAHCTCWATAAPVGHPPRHRNTRLPQRYSRRRGVAPGPIIPPESLTQSEIEEVERATPLGRWGGGGEIASAVVGLLQTDFVTGETIRVDGGRHLR